MISLKKLLVVFGIFVTVLLHGSPLPEDLGLIGLIENIGIEWIPVFALRHVGNWGGASNPVVLGHDTWEGEDADGEDDNLIDGMSENISPHDLVDDGSRFGVWSSVQNIVHWWLGCQGEGTEGIHDKVNPEHLDGVQRGITEDGGTEEDDGHSSEVDGKLELQEFSDTVVDVTAVLEGDNN